MPFGESRLRDRLVRFRLAARRGGAQDRVQETHGNGRIIGARRIIIRILVTED